MASPVVVLCLAWSIMLLFVHAQAEDPNRQQVYQYAANDLYGLQQLYAEWNKSTPDLGKNLAGWKQIPQDLASRALPCPCYEESWQGVLCLRQQGVVPPGFTYQNSTVSIVGLRLEGASLTGSLPPAIGKLSSLVLLTLTGNKKLTGRLPQELQFLSYNLNVLNLQGNGFKGSIPTTIASLIQLQELDLSGNQFNGTLDVDFSQMTWLRTLNLSHNLLHGNINPGHFQNLGQLIKL